MMNRFQVVVVFFLFISPSKAQYTSTPLYGSHNLHPSIAIVIGAVGIFVLVLLSVFAYTKTLHRNVPDLVSTRNNLHQFLRSRSSLTGIDRNVIESIPFFKFSSLKGLKEGLECSICLSIFKESEILRLLPNCKHAFHTNCIDKWLESHASCPLCRYKFDSGFSYTSSLRYDGNPSPSNLVNRLNLELFVEREEDTHGSTRFNLRNSFRKLNKSRNEDSLASESDVGQKLHKFKHKIIVSDIFHKRRWSDLNSSDLMSLKAEMLNVVSSKRFNTNNPRHGLPLNKQLSKIKEDIKKKRIFESRKAKTDHTTLVSGSGTSSPPISNGGSKCIGSRLVTSTENRSMSDITILTRFKDSRARSNRATNSSSLRSNSRDERIRRLWPPIARRTMQWFAVRENNSEGSDTKLHASNV